MSGDLQGCPDSGSVTVVVDRIGVYGEWKKDKGWKERGWVTKDLGGGFT